MGVGKTMGMFVTSKVPGHYMILPLVGLFLAGVSIRKLLFQPKGVTISANRVIFNGSHSHIQKTTEFQTQSLKHIKQGRPST